jgi:hydrogenase maturation protease
MSVVGARRVVIAAVGCEFRRDDGAGPAVLDRLRGGAGGAEVLGTLASPLDLLGAWDGAELAIVVDAVAGGAEPGELHVVEVDLGASPDAYARPASRASSHGLGVIEVLLLARAQGSAPARVVLVGIGGEDFSEGVGLSPCVSGVVERTARIVAELAGAAPAGVRYGRGFAATLTTG